VADAHLHGHRARSSGRPEKPAGGRNLPGCGTSGYLSRSAVSLADGESFGRRSFFRPFATVQRTTCLARQAVAPRAIFFVSNVQCTVGER
jgi:hypothetical protein